jgi:hypothetical protein
LKTKKVKTWNEPVGLIFTIVFLVLLIDSAAPMLSSGFNSIRTTLKTDWIVNTLIVVSLIGIIMGMELRSGRIKPILGIVVCSIALVIASYLRFFY